MGDSVSYCCPSVLPGLVLGQGRFSRFEFGRHYHLDYHVGVVTQGRQLQRLCGSASLLGPGNVSIVPPDEIHDGSPDDEAGYSLRTFRITPELYREWMHVSQESDRVVSAKPVVRDDPLLAQRLSRLHAYFATGQTAGIDMLAEEQATDLQNLLVRLISGLPAISDDRILSRGQWNAVHDYCQERLAERISLDDLAAVCELSRFQFLRHFKRTHGGITPHEWLLRRRLEVACRKIRQGGRSMAQIAAECGFFDQSHFARHFRRTYGVAPSCY